MITINNLMRHYNKAVEAWVPQYDKKLKVVQDQAEIPNLQFEEPPKVPMTFGGTIPRGTTSFPRT